MQVLNWHPTRPIIVSALIILSVFGWLLLEIPQGILSQSGDEMLTAERSREMLLLGRSAVHFNFEPSFEKPPLQYWLTTLTLSRFANKTLAVRIWPWFYGLLTAIAAGWLARLIEPERPWAAPLSITLLCACPLFATDASRGLLDTGLAFFTTIGIAFAQVARKQPQWWAGVALASWMASLQKIPLTFLIWLLIVAVRWWTERRQLRTRWLWGSLLAAIVAMALWPAYQLLAYHIPWHRLFNQEVVDHLGPERLGANPFLEIPYRLVVTSAIGLFLLLAPIAILTWKRARFTPASIELSIVCLVLLGLEVLSNFRNVRYVEAILPVLCILLAVVLHRCWEQGRAFRTAATALIAIILIAGLVQTELQIRYRRKNLGDEKQVAEELGRLQRDGVGIVLVKAIKVGSDLHFGSFYLFHGGLRFPITKCTVDQIRESPPRPPLIGVCVERDFPVVQSAYPAVQTQFTQAQFIVWRVE
jgi:4-amino-4-deoxy-L-arabinose transferase-like glycosyltransferase